MKIRTLFLPMLLLLAFGASCTGQKPSNAKSKTETSDELGEPTGDEIRELGRILSARDAGYPMFVVEIEFPERQFSETFLLNIWKNTTTWTPPRFPITSGNMPPSSTPARSRTPCWM